MNCLWRRLRTPSIWLLPIVTGLCFQVGHCAELDNVIADGEFFGCEKHDKNRTLLKGDSLGPWQVVAGDIGLHVSDLRPPVSGGNSIDLNGTVQGAISQFIQVRRNRPYTIRFLMSGNWTKHPEASRTLRVTVDDIQKDFTLQKPAGWSTASMQWVEQRLEFTSRSPQTRLQFRSLSGFTQDTGPVICEVSVTGEASGPGPLETVAVPLPSRIEDFVQNREKAIVLGKAFFWDIQAGSDGKTACATCHWHAGADMRLRNTVSPGPVHPPFNYRTVRNDSASLRAQRNFRGPNQTLRASDFPFYRLRDPLYPVDPNGKNPILFDTSEVTGSQGVVSKSFVQILPGRATDTGRSFSHPIFQVSGSQIRQVTARNAPSVINTVYFDRLFLDGRANHFFNGVNSSGELDRHARVLKLNSSGKVDSVPILIDHAALASQAVAPVVSGVETSWDRRPFSELGRKLLSLRPLALQTVAGDDSVLGAFRHSSGRGLNPATAGYAKLIREAFRPEWWSSSTVTPFGYTQMEENFSLFWGLSIMLYESTLISDQTPYDRFARGEAAALSPVARRGLEIFLNEGKCIGCHEGPEFAGATVSRTRSLHAKHGIIEWMASGQGPVFYDSGFYNIGVRPSSEDPGLGSSHPKYGPLSYVMQERLGRNPDPRVTVGYSQRLSINGAFKTPSLRNAELTGPYMHNGGMKSLREVVQFYSRGGNFPRQNSQDLAPDIHEIPALQKHPENIDAVVEFLTQLTDPRVRYQRAPFDHPELLLPHGHAQFTLPEAMDEFLVLPATGKGGGAPLQTFEDALEKGLDLPLISGGVK